MILTKHVLTEKVFKLGKVGTAARYCFYVAETANKITVKKELEKIFAVVVDSVNILNNSKKVKKVFLHGKSFDRVRGGKKKAYVTLKKGYSIVFENNI
ncbi:MAG: 50S ribosomal protein L23 [Cytophagales bacterium]|jgi:large subunit ribosomal protein L23|nr:50S ribosomal protein L23 [Cytophagales bacterium]